MRKIGLLLVLAAVLFNVAGCNGGDDDPNPLGTWVAEVDWGCTGGSYTDVMHFYSTGLVITNTFTTTGNWSADANSIAIAWSNGSTWVGTFADGDTISGTTTSYDSLTGCWSATRISDTP